MATIRKRGPFQWQAQVRQKGYPLLTKTFDTKMAARAWARKTETEMDLGEFICRAEAESTTLGQLLERYRSEVTPRKKGIGPETARIGALLRNKLARRFISNIRSSDIAEFRDYRLNSVCPGTVKRDLTVLSHLFEISRKEWGIEVRNPVRDVSIVGADVARNRRLVKDVESDLDEELELISACESARNKFLLPVVLLALETAMRQGELVCLKWQHIDLGRRTAFLPDTKNGQPRTVPLSPKALEILRTLKPNKGKDVFPTLTTEAIKKCYRRAVRRAGLSDLRFHDLRHEATTRLFEKGLNIMEVAAITGHRDIRMLQRYTHLKAEELAMKLV